MELHKNLTILKRLYQLKSIGFNYINTQEVDLEANSMITVLPNSLSALEKMINQCHLCDLSKRRKSALFAKGDPQSDIMFVIDSVTVEDENNGSFSTSKSGQLLTKMVEAVLERPITSVYVTHFVKCPTTLIEEPTQHHINSCEPFFTKQLQLIQPKLVVALGANSYQFITNDTSSFYQLRGHLVEFENTQLLPTHSLQTLLRNPSLKKEAYQDFLTIKANI
jgi:DNA polymerase